MDPEGNTYEGSAIRDWLSRNETSPITREPLTAESLRPNRALAAAIERLRNAQQQKEVAQERVAQENHCAPEHHCTTQEQRITLQATGAPCSNPDEVEVLVSACPPVGTTPTPTDVCLVIDTSGSMGTIASIPGDTGARESHGLSLLDVVKHAVRTIIHTLSPGDRLSVVSFSSSAQVVFGLMNMNSAGQATAERMVKDLRPGGQTNVWDGLQSGLQTLRDSGDRRTALFILTDGKPNVSPPRGEAAMLQRYLTEHQMSSPVSTFGFGYEVQSSLLLDLCTIGQGMYFFIPDATFVGTTFVHAASNLLATATANATLELQGLNGAQVLSTLSLRSTDSTTVTTSERVSLRLGTIQYGQQRDVLVRLRVTPPEEHSRQNAEEAYLAVTMKYRAQTGEQLEATAIAASQPDSAGRATERAAQQGRVCAVQCLNCVMAELQCGWTLTGHQNAMEAIGRATAMLGSLGGGQAVQSLAEDLTGQVSLAVSSKEFYSRWGVHYLPSLARAHTVQQCSNFKDPGVQHYGGDLFQSLRDKADDTFCALPPPQPTVVGYSQPHYAGRGVPSSGSRAAHVHSMAAYHNRSGGCFHGNSLVSLADGTQKRAAEVVKGDRVKTACRGSKSTQFEGEATVLGVMKTIHEQGVVELVELPGGLQLTPWHPVRADGVWRFPADLAKKKKVPCDAVFSFVLDQGHVLLIDSWECIGLGHDLQDSCVKHPFFGSQRVVQALAKCPGWKEGLVQFKAGCFTRDSEGLVCGFNTDKLVTNS